MFIDIFLFGIILLSVGGIFYIIISKFFVLKNIDPEQIFNEKKKSIRRKITERKAYSFLQKSKEKTKEFKIITKKFLKELVNKIKHIFDKGLIFLGDILKFIKKK